MKPLKVINHSEFIAGLKSIHRGQGKLTLHARNPNRKQFYIYGPRQHRYGRGTLSPHRFQQDLPAEFATYFAVYSDNMALVKSVINLYKKNGVNVLYQP